MKTEDQLAQIVVEAITDGIAPIKASIARIDASSADTETRITAQSAEVSADLRGRIDSIRSHVHALAGTLKQSLEMIDREISGGNWKVRAIREDIGAIHERITEIATGNDDIRTQVDSLEKSEEMERLSRRIDDTRTEHALTSERILADIDRLQRDLDSHASELVENLPPVSEYREDRTYTAGAVVYHRGGAWQSILPTTDAPGESAAWRLLANGVSRVETEGTTLTLHTSDGKTFASGDLKGDPGDSFTFRDVWSDGEHYRAMDVVIHAGSGWIALRDTRTKPPGDDWKLLYKRGKTGPRGPEGKSPDPAEIMVMVSEAWEKSREEITRQIQMTASEAAASAVDGTLRYAGKYHTGNTYSRGDLVTFGGAIYVARDAVPVNITPGSPVGASSWEFVIRSGGGSGGGIASSNNTVSDIIRVTQAEYDAIPTPNPTTLYVICG